MFSECSTWKEDKIGAMHTMSAKHQRKGERGIIIKAREEGERERNKEVRLVLFLGQTCPDDHNRAPMYARCRFCVDSTMGIPETMFIICGDCFLLSTSPCELPVLFGEEKGAASGLWA